jgi:murein DD-endopeptidase MepM/ murein hydrolase activator NlpD
MAKIIIIYLLISFVFIYGDELAEKQQELERLENELREMENLILQTRVQKAEKEARKQELDREKKQLEARISELERSQTKAQKEWDTTRERLISTTRDLDNRKQTVQQIYNSALELSRALLTSHYSTLIYPNADAWLLATSLEAAGKDLVLINTDISSLENSRTNLEKKEKSDEKYFKDVQWTKIISKKKKSTYQKELITIEQEVTSLDKEYNNALERKNELEKIQAEMNDLVSRLQKKIPYKPAYSYKFSSDRLIWPVQGRIIRSYGSYPGGNDRVTLYNDGIDIAVDIGTDVKCVDNGVVVFSGRNSGSGRVVIIDHQNGYYSIYSHNDHLLVSLGDIVEKGTILAKSGQSGFVEEPCLHFEIRKDGKAANPLEYLEY